MAGPTVYLVCNQDAKGNFSATFAIQVDKNDTEKQAAEKYVRFCLSSTPVGKIGDETTIFVRKNMNENWKKFHVSFSVVVKIEITEQPIQESAQ